MCHQLPLRAAPLFLSSQQTTGLSFKCGCCVYRLTVCMVCARIDQVLLGNQFRATGWSRVLYQAHQVSASPIPPELK